MPEATACIVHPVAAEGAVAPAVLLEALSDALAAVADGGALFEADGTPLLQTGKLLSRDGVEAGAATLFAEVQRLRERFRADLADGWLAVSDRDIENVLDTVMARFDASAAGGGGAPAIEASWIRLPGGRRLLLQRDVSDDRQRRHDLLENNLRSARDAAQLQAMHDALTDGIALVGPHGNVIAVNRTLRMQGSPAWARAGRRNHIADIIWNDVLDNGGLTSDEDRTAELARQRARFETADGTPELRQTPDGRWVEVRWRALGDGQRLLLHRDISERMRHEAALEDARLEAERTRALMQTVLETMQDGVLLVDADEVCRYANAAAIAMHEMPPELLARLPTITELGQWLAAHGEYGAPEETPGVAALALHRLRTVEGYSHTRQRRNGRWIEYSCFRVHEGGTLAVFRDVTALKDHEAQVARERDAAQAARAEAEAANLAKSTFLATMSHEIRTPMNGVIGMMDVLESPSLTGAQRQVIGTMRESAVTLLRIVSDVLDFSKIEAGRLELEEAPFSLAALVAGCTGTLRPRAVAQGLTLTEHVDAAPDLLFGDATRIRQILFNLLGNAIKFTEQGGVSVIGRSAQQPDGGARVDLVVSDTGVGIAPDVLPRLFNPFTQGDSSTTRRFGGTGLGLSIVRRLTELMDGRVQLESRPGEGARFQVTLHLRAAAPAQATAQAPPVATWPAPGIGRVLVIDDHPVNRDVLLGQLGRLGVAVDAVADGEEGLTRWQAGAYSLVLSDLHMPGLDGFQLVRQLRAREVAEHRVRTPVIAVTATALAGEPERCAAADMDGFLAKPVTIDRLRATLERWLTLAQPAEPPAPAPAAIPALDPPALAAWLGNDEAAIRAMLDRFLASARASEAELAAAVATRMPEVPYIAHRLKGAALVVGARGIAAVAAELERAGGIGDATLCAAAATALGAEIRRLAAELGAV